MPSLSHSLSKKQDWSPILQLLLGKDPRPWWEWMLSVHHRTCRGRIRDSYYTFAFVRSPAATADCTLITLQIVQGGTVPPFHNYKKLCTALPLQLLDILLQQTHSHMVSFPQYFICLQELSEVEVVDQTVPLSVFHFCFTVDLKIPEKQDRHEICPS